MIIKKELTARQKAILQNEEALLRNVHKLDDLIGRETTYKQITDILTIKYVSGNSKEKQLNTIKRYYELDTTKAKIKIVKKYDEPLAIEDNRQSAYYDDLETLILYALHNDKSSYNTWSVKKALLVTCLTNNNYIAGRRNLNLTAEALEVNKDYLYNFYNYSNNELKRIFETSLNRMQNKKLIQYNTCTIVCRKESYIVLNELYQPYINEQKEIEYKVREVYTEATKEERELILKVENEVMQTLKCKSTQEMILKKRFEKHRTLVNKELRKRANIEFYYNAYSIVKYNKGIAEEIKELDRTYSENTINTLKVKKFISSEESRMNSNKEDKEILIEYLIDNKCNMKLETLLANLLECKEKEKEENKRQELLQDMKDNVPF